MEASHVDPFRNSNSDEYLLSPLCLDESLLLNSQTLAMRKKMPTSLETPGLCISRILRYLLVTGSEPYEQLEALETCCNAALGDAKSCSLVANAGAIYIIQIVHGTNLNLIKVALTTLGNLCMSSENVCKLLHEQGLLPALLDAIKVEETREAAVKTLCQFCYLYLPRLSDEEAVQCVNSSLQFFRSHSVAQWLIGQLSAREAVRLKLSELHVPAVAVELLLAFGNITPDNVRSVTALIRLIGNSQFPLPGYMSSFGSLVSSCKYPHVRKEFAWMMSSLRRDSSVEMEA